MALWHSRDARTPKERANEKIPSEVCYYDFASEKIIKLNRDPHERIQISRCGDFALGIDSLPVLNRFYSEYGLRALPYDYSLINVKTGGRLLIEANLPVFRRPGYQPVFSPDGTTVLYRNKDADYVACDTASGTKRNLTAGLGEIFRKPNDPAIAWNFPGVSPFLAWSKDGDTGIVTDGYDLWAMPLRAGSARNLTRNGRGLARSYYLLEGSQSWDFSRPAFCRFKEPYTGRQGLTLIKPGAEDPIIVHGEQGSIEYLVSDSGETRLCSIETSSKPGNYYLLSRDGELGVCLTDVNPQQLEISWPPDAKLLSYKMPNGDSLRAALYLPLNYIPGRKYPTVILDLYERGGEPYMCFRPDHPYFGRWQRRGYAVLLPEVQPRINEAGRAALEAVVSAVEAACRTGIVDRNRLGISGHSHGAFEVLYIIGHSELFKAAVAKAGNYDMISLYGEVYENGEPRARLLEVGQPYLAGPWWENWNAYIDNSPLFKAGKITTPLLIAHGDADKNVAFAQSLEMFIALQRLKNPNCVMLQYIGEDHMLKKRETLSDLRRRVEQFFDHYLLGEPAPPWWTEGKAVAQGKVPDP